MFERHGGKSVILGRFIGPLRPLVPAIAGAAGMRPSHFVLMNLIAALIWAPAYALPGFIVGATLSLAAEVASRMALLLTVIFIGGWLIAWLTTHVVRLLQRNAEPALLRMMDWSHKHRRLGHLGPALADPDQPETPILAACVFLLTGLGWLIGHLLWNWPQEIIPPSFDATLYDWLAAMLNSWTIPIAWALHGLSSTNLNLILGVSVLLILSSLGYPRAAAHWVAGFLGGALLGVSLPGDGIAIGPQAVLSAPAVTTLSLTCWFTLAGLLATSRRSGSRITIYVLVGIVAALVILAKLMLGQISFSQSSLAVVLALVWASLLILGYRRHLVKNYVALRVGSISALLALIMSLSYSLQPGADELIAEQAQIAWEQDAASPRRVNLLWHGSQDDIQAVLLAQGWQGLPAHEAREFVRWLKPHSAIQELPPAPQWLAGRPPDLRFSIYLDGQSHVLRLWQDHNSLGPIWYGQAGELQIRHWAGLLRVPVTRAQDSSLDLLQSHLGEDWEIRRSRRRSSLLMIYSND